MTEPPSTDGAAFSAQLAGRLLRSDAASLVLAEWSDNGGGGDPLL